MQTRQIFISQPGGPERLELRNAEVGDPGPGEIRIVHRAVGLNFIDVYYRSGAYPAAMPLTLGLEASGVVDAVGEGVTHLREGDRAAYASQPNGAYSDARVMPAAQVCPIPDAIDYETGAAMMLKGLTVQYLFHRTVPLQAGDTVLFHAAAGGVGLIACNWARSEGIRLIGTAGSDEKCAAAKHAGAADVINYRQEDFAARVKELTDGRGVDAVMDGVGADTFDGSLDCLRPLGTMISYGSASGPVPPFTIATLGQKGSLFVTRPTIFTHIADHETCQAMARMLCAKVESGAVEIEIGRRYPLEQAAEAHRALEARETTGSTILTL